MISTHLALRAGYFKGRRGCIPATRRVMSDNNEQPLLLFTSSLGDDTLPIEQSTLHAIALEATEGLTQPYEIRLTVVSSERTPASPMHRCWGNRLRHSRPRELACETSSGGRQ